MWPFKKKPIDNRVADEPEPVKPAEKELPELKWELSIGNWHKELRCEHCGHVWTDDTKSHDEDPCPECGCIGSHKMQVVRHEYEHTQRLNIYDGIYPDGYRARGISIGRVERLDGWGLYHPWRGTRNEKTVIWDGCSVKKDSNDE